MVESATFWNVRTPETTEHYQAPLCIYCEGSLSKPFCYRVDKKPTNGLPPNPETYCCKTCMPGRI